MLDSDAALDAAVDAADAELLDAVLDPDPQPASVTLNARAATPIAGTSRDFFIDISSSSK